MKNRFLIPILAAAAAIFASGCLPDQPVSAERQQQHEVDQELAQANAQVGIAHPTNFTEKALANKIIDLRDTPNLATYTYLQGMDGKLRCLGRSIGFGLPYSTQTTNPEKQVEARYSYHDQTVVLPQAEPNGLYMPPSADATWVLLVNEKTGEAAPTYVEPHITVSTFPMTGPAVSAPCPTTATK